MNKWEIIIDERHQNKETKRLAVPRGWLVLYRDWTGGNNEVSTNMVFVEDLHHEWSVTND